MALATRNAQPCSSASFLNRSKNKTALCRSGASEVGLHRRSSSYPRSLRGMAAQKSHRHRLYYRIQPIPLDAGGNMQQNDRREKTGPGKLPLHNVRAYH